jgi:hypothetical protein
VSELIEILEILFEILWISYDEKGKKLIERLINFPLYLEKSWGKWIRTNYYWHQKPASYLLYDTPKEKKEKRD